MIIKKFIGKTEADARAQAVAELGEQAVVMNVKVVKPTGIFKFLKKTTYEVTAAIDEPKNQEKEKTVFPSIETQKTKADSSFTAVVDDSREIKAEDDSRNGAVLEERIENLQHFLEEQFKQEEKREDSEAAESELSSDESEGETKNISLPIVKMIYRKLLDNEVDEKYVNQIIDDVQKVITPSSGLDFILANVYQKIILKFGQPKGIDLSGKKPKVVFLVGPTGVGKTTTIAKIASNYKVEKGKKIALLTSDTYRIAATDQLRVYANILDVPLTIIYSGQDLNNAIDNLTDYEIVLVDTAGFSHKNVGQKEEIKELLTSLDEKYDKEVFLVLSATTKYKDLQEIVDAYKELTEFKLIFTKLDETTAYGNLLNIKLYTNAELSYTTNGQNVPDDIEIFNIQRMVKQLLGGK